MNEILIALIGAGLLTTFVDGVKWVYRRRQSRDPEVRSSAAVATADASLSVVARARDELEADNARLRADRAECDARHLAERQQWESEKRAMRAEIDRLEGKLRELLNEVENLRIRHS